MRDLSKVTWDVIVVGGGNAGLCAAIEAAESGARVLILESAPKTYRGGNSRHTRNFRCMHDGPLSVLTGTYGEDEYFDDLIRVTKGKTDEALARMTIRTSEDCLPWMEAHGVAFQKSLSGTLSLSRTNAFFLGGGKALVNAYYNTVEDLGVTVAYDAEVSHIAIEDGAFTGLDASIGGTVTRIEGRALVLASGGFQADLDWLADAWGPAARNFLIRGTPYNRGVVLRDMLDQGADSVGDPTQCHAVAIDGRSPKFDGGIVTRLDCVPFSIVVNKNGERFYDEGEDVWPKRYAIWGRLVAAQPDQIAYIIFDSTVVTSFMPTLFPPIAGQTVAELAGKLELDPAALEKTITEFNAAVRPGTFDHTILDDCVTEGITPPKTHWARKIETPPYLAYPVRPGITFTYLGTRVNKEARMLMADGKPSANMFAAGEIMAGNVLGKGYAAGMGMTIGSVFGRIAGREAAKHARN